MDKLQAGIAALGVIGPALGVGIATAAAASAIGRNPEAAGAVRRCPRCGNLAEGEACAICADERRDPGVVCVVEHVPDLVAIERCVLPGEFAERGHDH